MRVRKRAVGLLLGAGVLFLIGTNVQAGWLFVLAALLLGALASGIALAARSLAGLEVEVHAPAETRQGDETPVDLVVRNRGRAARWGVVASDEHLGGATAWVGTVRPGERVTVTTMRGAPRRGEAHTGGAQLRSAAPFGVAERRRRRPVDAATLVLPRTEPLGPLAFIETTTSRETATRTEPRRGQGREYLSVREYRAGDPMRHVHWGLTARHGELMVREFEQERTPRLAIWVDTESDDLDRLDRCCTVAASIVDSATATGAGVRVAAADPDGPALVTRTHHLEYHRWLARLVPTGIPADHRAGLARRRAAARRRHARRLLPRLGGEAARRAPGRGRRTGGRRAARRARARDGPEGPDGLDPVAQRRCAGAALGRG